MQVTSVKSFNNTNFKGYTKYYHISDDMYSRYDCRHLTLSDEPLRDYFPSYSETFEDKFQRALYPNVKVEKTGNSKGKVYIADPMEGISDEIRKSVDYIVHDVVPAYPDVNEEVSHEYFYPSYGNEKYAKKFETIRDYYKRLEAADLRTLSELKLSRENSQEVQDKIAYYKARIQDSEYQQWQAQECLNIYNKGKDLRLQKFEVEKEIGQMQGESRRKYGGDVRYYTSQIEKQNNEINKMNEDVAILNGRKSLYHKLIKQPQYLNYNYAELERIDYKLKNEEQVLTSKSKKVDALIKKYEAAIAKAKKEIISDEQSITDIKNKAKELAPKIAEKEALLSEIKAKLIPLFDELKHFYAKQRILRP